MGLRPPLIFGHGFNLTCGASVRLKGQHDLVTGARETTSVLSKTYS
jgi:hypothetical protein